MVFPISSPETRASRKATQRAQSAALKTVARWPSPARRYLQRRGPPRATLQPGEPVLKDVRAWFGTEDWPCLQFGPVLLLLDLGLQRVSCRCSPSEPFLRIRCWSVFWADLALHVPRPPCLKCPTLSCRSSPSSSTMTSLAAWLRNTHRGLKQSLEWFDSFDRPSAFGPPGQFMFSV